MYRQSINKRRYSTTPIVRVTTDSEGNEKEEVVLCITNMPKEKGEEFAQALLQIMELLY